MTTLELIIAELDRQTELPHGNSLDCFSAVEPQRTLIDGYVDLVALAAAIDKEMVARARLELASPSL
jgi:hypothetical protein